MATVVSVIATGLLAPSALVLLGFLAVVIVGHEAGHFFAARRAGMAPTAFFWGFGPEVCAIERNGCRYGIKAFFLGGFVKLEGMTPSSELPEGFDPTGAYRSAAIGGRLLASLAGPAANLAMAMLAFAAATALEGASLGTVLSRGVGDVWFVIASTGEALWIWGANVGTYVGAVADTSGVTEAPVRFMSPVTQAEVSGLVLRSGPVTTLRWFGILSCAIGVVNLLPLPPLDGSHATVAAVEGIVNKLRPRDRAVALDATKLVPLAYATITVLVLLSVSALVLDIRDIT